MMHNWNNRVNQGLHLMLLVLVMGAFVATTGCSWCKHTPAVKSEAKATPTPEAPAPKDNTDAHAPGTKVPFPAGAMDTIYFDFDKSTLRANQVEHLDKDAKYLMDHPTDKVYIEGHADERGSIQYNFSLGQRRADAVKDYFVKKGVVADRIATASKGKETPADPGHNEKAWKKNRRVEFFQLF